MRTYSAGIVTAYGSAKAGGYTGTYAEFCEALGNLADVLEDLEGLTVVANTLPEGSTATASYTDGVLTLGIPKGDKGDKGDRGETGNGIASIVKTSTSGLVDTYTITYTDGNTETFTVTNGAKGDTGEKGETGNGIESVELTSTSGAVKTYTITFTDGTTTTFDVTDGEVTEASLEQTLEDYALIDGYYEEMTVGDAEQLVATQYVEDSEPYLFRTTGGSADVGNREYVDEIVGGSVGWNQLARPFESDYWQGESGVTVTCADGVATISSETAGNGARSKTGYGVNVIKDHKYFASIDAKCSTTLNNLIFGAPSGSGAYFYKTNFSSESYVTISGVKNCISTMNNYLFVYGTGTTYTDLMVKNFVFIDLTQMFGSTIADYIYTLEQSTAGAGVAFFKKLFPKPYYPYNAGELISVSGLSSHDTVGFNQWDEQWEVGGIANATGATFNASDRIRSKNFCACVPSTTYYGKAPSTYLKIYWYDASQGFISYASASNTTFTAPSNASYFKLVLESATTYNNDICINLSWSGYRNGEYEEYQKHSYALDDSLTLRGVPKLDSSNNLYYDGDTYASDGMVTRKYGVVDLGSLTWTKNWGTGDPTGVFYSPTLDYLNVNGDVINKNYIFRKGANPNTMEDKSITLFGSNRIYVKDTSYTDATAFKTAMSGVYLVYELATPTTESAEPYQQVQICDDFGTEEFVSTSIVPVGHNTRYPDNLRDKLQHLPHLADSDGYYMISQQNNSMSLELFRIPKAPTSPDGTYVLKATVSGGTPTYSWVAEE